MSRLACLGLAGIVVAYTFTSALAAPPYVTDDPQPTEYGHYEIYAFTAGTTTMDGTGGQAGFDLNYGGAKIYS